METHLSNTYNVQTDFLTSEQTPSGTTKNKEKHLPKWSSRTLARLKITCAVELDSSAVHVLVENAILLNLTVHAMHLSSDILNKVHA